MTKRLYLLLYINLFFMLTYNLYAGQQTTSYIGLHFMVAFMQNEIDASPTGIHTIYVTASSQAASVTVSYPGSMQKFNVPANTVYKLAFTYAIENRSSEEISNLVVELTSDVPVTVYAFNSIKESTDSYSILPITYWGTQYVSINMPDDHYIYDVNNPENIIPRRGEFLCIAAYDSTIITFTPKATTAGGKVPGTSYSVVLNRGECYQVQSIDGEIGTNDLSGTIVNSTKPIGFLSGHVRASILQNIPNYDTKNHLAEMLVPTNAWGNDYLSVPFENTTI